MGTGYSQKKATEVITNERTFGKNTINNSEIKGIDYIFPDRIHGTYYDSYSGLLTAQLRGLSKNGKWMDNTGKVVQYDLKNKKSLWDKKIVYTTTSLQQFRNTIIYSIANKSICVDATSGEEIWKVKNNIYYVDANKKIGIGYKFKTSTGYTNLLEGIDLSNGNVIWQRELNREYGWNDIVSLTDSTLLVVASGLHKINLNTGKGWDHTMKTGKKDYKGNIAANAIGVAAGLLTGTFLMSTGHNLVRDLVSNTIVDSNFIYFLLKNIL
ncbi:MAG: hypothetical protein IPH89_15110 [Bacteroidetes bacterium]|nr:hypothetical protein [Bacteroidota bacterium]